MPLRPLAARGEPSSVVRAAVASDAPNGARLQLVTTADTVTATVSDIARAPGLGRVLPGIRISALIVDARETGPVVAGGTGGG
jgi:hypothetical protein